MKKVSIITPVYNGEKYLSRFLDSVLNQTYDNIEIILINDGSTDNSLQIIDSYLGRFEKKGYRLLCLSQENKGVAETINVGLKLYTGEYLIWTDPDDFFTINESIEKMAKALDGSADDVGLVKSYVYEVEDISLVVKHEYKHDIFAEDPFTNCVLENKFHLVAGSNMLKSNILREELAGNQIYGSRSGQNWQLLLPILYKYKIISIPEFLFTVVRREHSHSRENCNKMEVKLNKVAEHEDILKETISRLKNVNSSSKQKILTQIKLKYLKKRLEIYYQENMKEDFQSIYKQVKNEMPRALSIKDYLKKIILSLNLK